MTDSEPEPETVPTTTYLPDHLLAGGRTGIPAVRTVDDDSAGEAATDTADGEDDDADPTAELCRSWRRHRSGSFPF